MVKNYVVKSKQGIDWIIMFKKARILRKVMGTGEGNEKKIRKWKNINMWETRSLTCWRKRWCRKIIKFWIWKPCQSCGIVTNVIHIKLPSLLLSQDVSFDTIPLISMIQSQSINSLKLSIILKVIIYYLIIIEW